MNIQLPKRMNGDALPDLENVRQITLIGAKVAGITRFAHWIGDKYTDKAFRISALQALFPSTEKTE